MDSNKVILIIGLTTMFISILIEFGVEPVGIFVIAVILSIYSVLNVIKSKYSFPEGNLYY